MISKQFFVFLGSLVVFGNGHIVKTAVKTAVEEAKAHRTNLIPCWERESLGKPAKLSEPVYKLCKYVPSANPELIYVSGLDEKSDDYTSIQNMFDDNSKKFALRSLCLREGFKFFDKDSHITPRCYCKHPGCNVPMPLATYMDTNNHRRV